MRETKAFGTWDSPITPKMLSGETRLGDVQFDGDVLLWTEGRKGGTVLLAKFGEDAPVIVSGDLNVRGSVGYGGGAFHARGGQAVFCADNRVYLVELESGLPRALTRQFGGVASPVLSPDGEHVIFVHRAQR